MILHCQNHYFPSEKREIAKDNFQLHLAVTFAENI